MAMTRKQAQEEADRRWKGTPVPMIWRGKDGSIDRFTTPGVARVLPPSPHANSYDEQMYRVGYSSGKRKKDFTRKGYGHTWEEAFEDADLKAANQP